MIGGDFDGLLEILDPEVVWRSDGGGKVTAARLPVIGDEKVVRFSQRLMREFDPETMHALVREVNGAPGVVLVDPAGERCIVFGFSVRGGLITEVDAVINPEKLRHIDLGSM